NTVCTLAWSPDGNRIASGSYDRTARIWDVRTGRMVHRLEHPGTVWGIAWSPDGQRTGAAAGDDSLYLWDAQSGAEISRGVHNATSVQWSPDGTQMASSGSGQVKLWRPDEFMLIANVDIF